MRATDGAAALRSCRRSNTTHSPLGQLQIRPLSQAICWPRRVNGELPCGVNLESLLDQLNLKSLK